VSGETVIHCRECGKPDSANYTDPPRGRMIREQICFSCLYWIQVIEARSDHAPVTPAAKRSQARGAADDQPVPATATEVAIVGGRYYVVHPFSTAAAPKSLGYGGDRFTFRFADGRLICSNDVWNGSSIPARFRDRLPDNASLVPNEPKYRPTVPGTPH
jgi:hypothetical protein